jgi:uncharacterized protein YjaG (DUF416 family)
MVGEESFLASLSTLSRKKQLAFALLIFERLLPSLIAFAKDTGFDDSCFLQAKDAAWDALLNSKGGTLDQSLNEACLKNAPDTEVFSHELTSYALNAALAISDIIEFALDNRTDHIAHVSRLARDSVYLYLSSRKPLVASLPEEDRRLGADPLMQQELGREEEDIKFLAGLPDQFSRETVSALRARASSQLSILPPMRR